jgi:putative ABC transport system permease protein
VLVNKDTANNKGWKLGDTIQMQFEKTGVQPEKIQGIFDEDRSIGTAYLLSLQTYETNYVDQADSLVAIRKAPDVSKEETRATVERVLKPYPTVEVQDQTEFKDSQIAQYNTILNLLYEILFLAVVIAIFGNKKTPLVDEYDAMKQ